MSVARFPDRVALTCETRSLTYTELDQWSDELAATLPRGTETRGRPIGILLERSVEMVVAALAVLKAGAFYLPLDPTAPTTRNAMILEDAAPPIVVTSRHLASRLPEGLSHRIVEAPGEGSDTTPVLAPALLTPDDRAYVIFTSGTTGRPKGVEVTHNNVLRLFSTTLPLFDFTEEDVWTVFHSFAFDFSVWEIWGPLLHGGRAVVVPDEVAKDPALFRQLLHEQRVTILNQTPSAFQQVVAEDGRHRERLPLRLVVFGGEALRFTELEPWTDKYGTTTPALVNMYGITETTVHTTYHHVSRADVESGESVIGRPLPDLDIFLVDEELRHVPPGETGEIVVVGPGVSLGYRGQPDLTAQRFVTLKDRNDEPVRGYRSGDLARLRPDGLLVFLGRADSQVKIRGFRIELGEVEAALMRHPAVRQAAASVTHSRDGNAMLVAHLVPQADAVPDISLLREFLTELLPHYMIPSAVGELDKLPLTGNGKLDRAALPDVARTPSSPSSTSATPRSRTEAILCRLFAETLEQDTFGPDDDFFACGGHSLLAIALQRRVRVAFQEPQYRLLPLSQIYRTPSPAGISRWLGQAHTERAALPTWQEGDTLPLFRQQSDMLIRHVFDPDDLTDHCTMSWRVEGEVDTEVLDQAVSHVHDRHESLRARYRLEDEAIVEPADTPAPKIVVLRAATETAARTILREAVGRPFDLEQGEIWRVVVVTAGAGQVHFVAVAVHHIATDGWSESILAADLSVAYDALRAGNPPVAAPAPDLRQTAEAQLPHCDLADLDKQRAYWKSELLDLPALDFPHPVAEEFSSTPRSRTYPLPADLLQRVEQQAIRHGTTPFTVLLTAYGRALSELSGASDFGVGTPVALRGDARLEKAVSCLIDVLCLRMRFPNGTSSGTEDLRCVADTVRRAFAAQDVSFSEVVRLANPPRDLRPPLFQNMFALQNNATPDLRLTGAQTEFIRLPSFGLPTELVAEVRPQAGGGAELAVSYLPHRVDDAFASALGDGFIAHAENMTRA
ncbi:amino acid adenylation domain-containing protein [Streptomyces sp. NPDC001904]|uniref:non-ribosomal peptide synthetase n=1 Tax=Streptomyces sp. NPDC001904 TaxID=3154531 RepID=UPI0033277E1B